MDIDLTFRNDVNLNRTKISRFPQLPPNWGPGTRAGKKEGRTWRGKRKREDSIEMDRNEGGGNDGDGNADVGASISIEAT